MMKILLLLIAFSTQAWALTAAQEALLKDCYIGDALARGKDDAAQVQELMNFILLGRTAQKTQLTNVVQRCKDRITSKQGTLPGEQQATLNALNQLATDTDGTLTGIPALP